MALPQHRVNDEKHRERLLGMANGTARSRMMRAIAGELMRVKYNSICYRCGQEIEGDDFHIDHINSWQKADNPFQAFVDPNNIAFAHPLCNSLHTEYRRNDASMLDLRKKSFLRLAGIVDSE